jgi:hypothetical protein
MRTSLRSTRLVRRLLAEQLGPVGRAGDMTRAEGRLVVDLFWKLQPGGGSGKATDEPESA